MTVYKWENKKYNDKWEDHHEKDNKNTITHFMYEYDDRMSTGKSHRCLYASL